MDSGMHIGSDSNIDLNRTGGVAACRCPTTDWASVAAAGNAADADLRCQALERLVASYWRPLKAHLAAKLCQLGLPPQDVEECLQEFLLDKVLIEDILARADKSRGHFRTFLLKALDNHVHSACRRKRAQRRLPEEGLVPLSAVEEAIPIDGNTPVSIEDRLWARAVFEEAVERMRHECSSSGRQDTWLVLEGRVLGPFLRGQQPISYNELAERCGMENVQEARSLFHSAKRTFRRVFDSVVAGYAPDSMAYREEAEVLKSILMSSDAFDSQGDGGDSP